MKRYDDQVKNAGTDIEKLAKIEEARNKRLKKQ
jgi:hypothetical protein